MAKDYSKKMKESALIQQTEEYMDNEVFGEQEEQQTIQQPIPTFNQQMQTVAQPATPVVSESRVVSLGGPLVYDEATKGISVKLPYSLYDALDAIKKQTQRTGNPRDKMGIGDLVVLAVKEFVEKTLPNPSVE